MVNQAEIERDAEPAGQAVRKGPMEGMLIVNGRPQMERSDMPVISFESILAMQAFSAK